MVLRKLSLNMGQLYSEIGLKPAMSLGKEGARKGLSSASSYAGQKAREGNAMADIHVNRNYIPALARSKTRTRDPGLTVKSIPKSLVKMQVADSNRLDIFA